MSFYYDSFHISFVTGKKLSFKGGEIFLKVFFNRLFSWKKVGELQLSNFSWNLVYCYGLLQLSDWDFKE